MNIRQDQPSAVEHQFDEWAKAVAHGLTRRKTLQLIGGTLTGALVALRGPKAWAAPSPGTQGCGRVCAPLFNPANQAAFNSCTQACEDCQSCHGSPGLTNTSPQALVCAGATPCRSGSGVICCTVDSKTPANSQTCCQGACYNPCTGGPGAQRNHVHVRVPHRHPLPGHLRHLRAESTPRPFDVRLRVRQRLCSLHPQRRD